MKMLLTLNVSIATLLLLVIQEPSNQGAEAFPVNCCMKNSDIKVRRDQLKNYILQDKPLCPVKSVRFVTQKDVTFCLDPSSPWAINTMAYLDNKNSMPQDNNTTTGNN